MIFHTLAKDILLSKKGFYNTRLCIIQMNRFLFKLFFWIIFVVNYKPSSDYISASVWVNVNFAVFHSLKYP